MPFREGAASGRRRRERERSVETPKPQGQGRCLYLRGAKESTGHSAGAQSTSVLVEKEPPVGI